MDVAYYISDLLGQQGELSVPNLGYFVQIRMNARYDEQEKKFFPPHYSVQFDPQVIDDDDTLATYITKLKNISLASAKYFIEKYISNLKDSVIVEDVPFASLGSFSSDGIKLIFKSNTKTNDPDFFAYTPIDAYKIGEEHVAKPIEQQVAATPDTEQPVINTYEQEDTTAFRPEPPVVQLPLNPDDTEETVYEDEPRRRFSAWTILLIVLAIMAISLAGLYKFRPGMFGWYFSLHKDPYILSRIPVKPVKKDTLTVQMPAIKTDSLAKTDTSVTEVKTAAAKKPSAAAAKGTIPAGAVAANTTAGKPAGTKPAETKSATGKIVAQPVVTAPSATNSTAMPDVIPKGWWVIYAGASPIRSSMEKTIVNYKSMGFTQARLLTAKVGPGGNYKIILGAYATHSEAIDAKKALLVTGKLKESNLSVEQLHK